MVHVVGITFYASQMTSNAEKHGFSEKNSVFLLRNAALLTIYFSGLLISIYQDNPVICRKTMMLGREKMVRRQSGQCRSS